MKSSKILNSVASTVLGTPFIMLWNITNRCNLRCKFCNVWKIKMKELTTEEIKLAISNMDSMGISLINIDGGEPLIRNDLEHIAQACKNFGMGVTLNTNGTLVTKERANSLVNLFDEICVSIDGFEKTHDSFRGKGVYKKVIGGLKFLIEANQRNEKRCLIGVSAVITKFNTSDIIELIGKMKKLGTDFFNCCPVNDPLTFDIENLSINRELYPNKKDSEWFVNELLIAKKKYKNFILSSDKFIKLITSHFSTKVKICDIGKFSFFLDSSGNVCACTRFRKPLFNILDKKAIGRYKNNKGRFDSELNKIKHVCPGCLLVCTTEMSLRCKFPNSMIELVKNPLPKLLKISFAQ